VNTPAGVFLHQKKYAEDILKKFRMSNCNSEITPTEAGTKLSEDANDEPVNATLYRQIIGPLRYMCNKRPYIAHGVGLVSRFME